jgi:hypothetical protein
VTTKPRPRKGAAKAPPVKPAPKGTPLEVSEIEKLCARLKWLEADSEYQAAMASTGEESDALINVHEREQYKIVSRLAELRPETLWEVRHLLEFVRISFKGGRRTDEKDFRILDNVVASLYRVGRNIEEKARDEAYDKASAVMGICLKSIRSAA